MNHFRFYNKQDVLYLTRIRRFETKLGEQVQVLPDGMALETFLARSAAPYVLFGIPEDIGVLANQGIGGTDSAWTPFITAFLNIQSNDFLSGTELIVLGQFDFGDIKYLIEQHAHDAEEKTEAYRHAVGRIDDEVEELVRLICSHGKIPLAIGGGHNNAYPLIKGSAKGLHKYGRLPLAQINCINLDAHTDYRPLEGRHSGNGFRYAEEDGYLQKYCVVGAQENYLPQNVWLDIVNNPFIDLITYEDIFVHEKRNFIQAVAHACSFTEDGLAGIELDLDVIEHFLCSAQSPSGISLLHARQYLNFTGTRSQVAYLHICEGAAMLHDGRKSETMGKAVAFLVSDFIKAHLS